MKLLYILYLIKINACIGYSNNIIVNIKGPIFQNDHKIDSGVGLS